MSAFIPGRSPSNRTSAQPPDIRTLRFDKLSGLVPCIVRDAENRDVLMLAFMNEDAYARTLETGLACFYSRTRQRLWTKGETSGNTLRVKRIVTDCDRDTLLIDAEPNGPVCHTGARSCFEANER